MTTVLIECFRVQKMDYSVSITEQRLTRTHIGETHTGARLLDARWFVQDWCRDSEPQMFATGPTSPYSPNGGGGWGNMKKKEKEKKKKTTLQTRLLQKGEEPRSHAHDVCCAVSRMK